MTSATPVSINDYLQALREALRAADPALVQDAIYDAEQHLRAEIAAKPNSAEHDVLAEIVQRRLSNSNLSVVFPDYLPRFRGVTR